MNSILIIIGVVLLGFWGIYVGKPDYARPLDFNTTGPIALIIGIILLIIGLLI